MPTHNSHNDLAAGNAGTASLLANDHSHQASGVRTHKGDRHEVDQNPKQSSNVGPGALSVRPGYFVNNPAIMARLTLKQAGSIRIIGKASTLSAQLARIADQHCVGYLPADEASQ